MTTLGMAKKLLARDPALISEAEWSGVVLDVARIGGWERRYHTFSSRRSPTGFPDWVLVRPPRLLFVELKTEVGKVREDQQAWLDTLAEVGVAIEQLCAHHLWLDRDGVGLTIPRPSVEAYVWRPSDYEAVVHTLTGRRPRKEHAQP